MTLRKQSKLLASAGLILLSIAATTAGQEEAATDQAAVAETPAAAEAAPETPAAPKNPRRPRTFNEAMVDAGDDGVIAFCYGPDWNLRSTRMLKTFWNRKEVEDATGQAKLVAVPFYENPTPEQKEESDDISSGMRNPPHGICPTVMMFDRNGHLYAYLAGTDNLGDMNGELGIRKMREMLNALRKQQQLMAEADKLQGVERAKKLNEVVDLPIATPDSGSRFPSDSTAWSQHQRCSPEMLELIKAADPNDASGMVRRNSFDATGTHLYTLMGTKDGFLSPDFVPDTKQIEDACLKAAKDEALRPIDRQAALCLLIGTVRRTEGGGKRLKDLLNTCIKIDPNSPYGRMCQHLLGSWGNLPPIKLTSDQRKDQQKQDKERKDKEKNAKRGARSSEFR